LEPGHELAAEAHDALGTGLLLLRGQDVIDILVPVLNRPQNAAPLAASVEEATAVAFSLVFICTIGDEAQIHACKMTGARILSIEGGLSEYPRKMNHAFRKTDREFVFMAADDVIFEKGWDREALKVAKATGAGVIGTNDCANPSVMRGDFSTHPLVRRSYISERGASMDGPGFLCHEGYDHNQVDVEISKVAQVRRVWAFAPKSRICHQHPDFSGKKKDDTYMKGFRRFRKDRQLYLKRARTFA
jgi:hypothetical protein